MALNDLVVKLHLVGESKSAVSAMTDVSHASKKAGKEVESSFSSSTSRVGGMLESLGSKAERMGIPFASSLSTIGERFKDAETKGNGFLGMASSIGGAAVTGGLTAFIGLATESVKIAMDGAEAQSNLETAVRNTGLSFEQVSPSIDKTYNSMANLGFNADDVNAALTKLITSTGSVSVAQSEMGAAADLARFKNISLSDSASALAKVNAGNSRILKQMGIDLNVTAGGAKNVQKAQDQLAAAQAHLNAVQNDAKASTDQLVAAQQKVIDAKAKLQGAISSTNTVLDALKQKTHDAAASFSDTLAGKIENFKAHAINLGKKLGEKLLPALTKAADKLGNFMDWMSNHTGTVKAFGIAIGGIATALGSIWAFNKVKGIFDSMKGAANAIKNAKIFGGAGSAAGAASNTGLEAALAANTEATVLNTEALGLASVGGVGGGGGGAGKVGGAAGKVGKVGKIAAGAAALAKPGPILAIAGAISYAASVPNNQFDVRGGHVRPIIGATIDPQHPGSVMKWGTWWTKLNANQQNWLNAHRAVEQQYYNAVQGGIDPTKLIGTNKAATSPWVTVWGLMNKSDKDWLRMHPRAMAAAKEAAQSHTHININSYAPPAEIARHITRALALVGSR